MSNEEDIKIIKEDLKKLKDSLQNVEICLSSIKEKFDFMDGNISKIKNSLSDTEQTFSSFVDDGLKNMDQALGENYSDFLKNLNFDIEKIKGIRETLEKAKDKISKK